MLIDALSFTMQRSGALADFWGKLDAGQDASLGVASSARPFLVASRYAQHPQTTLVLIAGEDAADSFARNLAAYLGDEAVLRFRERSDTPFAPKKPDARQVACRMRAIAALARGEEKLIVASARSLLRCLAPVNARSWQPLVLAVGQDMSGEPPADTVNTRVQCFEDIAFALESMGYENTGSLEGPGSYCVRGGTLDVFPGNLVHPVRIDFFGDEVDEIRRIVPATGQTVASMQQVEVFPVREFAFTKEGIAHARKRIGRPSETNPVLRELYEKLEQGSHFDGDEALLPYLYKHSATLADYLRDDAVTVLLEPRSLFDDAQHAYDDIEGRAHGSKLSMAGLYMPPSSLSFGSGQCANYLSIMRVGGAVDDELPVKRVDVAGNPEKLFGRLRSLIDTDYTVVFSAPNFRVRQDMKLALVDHSLPIAEHLDVTGQVPARLKRGVVNVVDVDIPLGMIIPKARLALVSVSDTQGASSVRTGRRIDITEVTFPYKPGDYVVHAAHGIGFFRELIKREMDGVVRDYLLLEYAEGDKLYVPVEQLDRVTRYVGPEGGSPRLTRLNTADWSRALNKARKATKKLAFDLVDIYTRRAASQGFRYSPDSPWQIQMEEAFPYQETPDQLAAIAEVKADMQSPRPMDRLICGDVGFGKTEVALRAAFKAVQDNKQVMVLCPTTILAQQHYTTFTERLEPFDVRVEVLSRFRTPAEQKSTLEAFANGDASVLVGTHRLLSRDVNPRNLGLVIVDEEQRFGVGHKEQLKNIRESIDVLTLSATPIPRTMQMSLSGVRDMSLILTPPDERRAVEVHVGEWDPDVVSGAIRRELARGGQVYYVSNRIRSMDDAVERVHEAAEEARVGYAHGRMEKDKLERIMEEFAAGNLDVLVATTIIESGIDNPHTNTLIIEDSQRLGLAQMYQLKGRVGRSATQAYAYFMFPDTVPLTEEAQARLNAINEHTELGSGMRIAMRDLEIRGAGSMLGAEQSGNMSAVGFDLFAQMLAAAINAAREGVATGEKGLPPALSDIAVNVPAHAYVPEEYMSQADERVLLYRRIASADTVQAVDELYAETIKLRPEMPSAARNMFSKARIKALANEHHIRLVSVVAGKLVVEPVALSRDTVSKYRRYRGRYDTNSKKFSIPVAYVTREDEHEAEEGEMLLANIAEFLQELLGVKE